MLLTLLLVISMALPPTMAPIPPCRYEDGSGQPGVCYWDARTMGNGQGDGVFVYDDGTLIFEH